MTNDQKKIYEKIEDGCSHRYQTINIDKSLLEDMMIALYALNMDCPQYFWIRHYKYRVYDEKYVADVSFELPMNIDYTMEKINSKVKSIFADMSAQNIDNDYDKLKYFYDWIINHTNYGETSDSQEITSVFINNTSVCAGYSKAFLYLCQRSNIECAYVSGYTKDNVKHAWNLVKLAGKYYWVDTTWGDPVYAGEGSDDSINYNFFLVDDGNFLDNHDIETGIEVATDYQVKKTFTYPKCTDDSLIYYKENGAYFEKYSTYQISTYLKEKFSNNIYTNIELKFKDKNHYDFFIAEYIEDDNAYIYDDIRDVNPYFSGTVLISSERIDDAKYIKLNITLNRS